MATAIAKTGLTLTADTWYHVYLYMNGANPDIEIVTTAPAAAYHGTARSKTGATTHRYLGSIKTGAANTILNFMHDLATSEMKYNHNINYAALYIVNNGTSTTEVTVSCTSAVPVTGKQAIVFAENPSVTASAVYIGNADTGSPITNILAFIRNGRALLGPINLTASQTFTYQVDSGGRFDCWVVGYTFER